MQTLIYSEILCSDLEACHSRTVTASQARVVSLVCIWTRTEPTTHTQWSALCVLKWHKSFRTYDYSWGPTLCVTLSNIAAYISILTYFRHLSARSIEKAVVTFSMNRAFFRHCSEATFVMAILDSHASELFSEIRWSVHTWAWGIFWDILHFTSTSMKWYKKGREKNDITIPAVMPEGEKYLEGGH